MRASGPDLPALHERAIDDLSFIRRTMEGASAFTDVPGWGLVAVGATALGASVLAAGQPTVFGWLSVWLVEAVLAVAVGGAATWRKMRRRSARANGAPVLSVPARKFLLGFWPAIVAGAVLTGALVDPALVAQPASALPAVLPGMWLLLYGVGVLTAGAYSVRPVPLLGGALMALGTVTLLMPGRYGTVALAMGFGALQMAFGGWIVRHHGG